jgi:hypothetical protein
MEQTMKNCPWEIAVVLCIRDFGGDLVDLQRIYQGMEKYRELTKEEQEIEYGQPRYTHYVRSCLAKLKKFKIVNQKGRGMYYLTPLGRKMIPIFEGNISMERMSTTLKKEGLNLMDFISFLKHHKRDDKS